MYNSSGIRGRPFSSGSGGYNAGSGYGGGHNNATEDMMERDNQDSISRLGDRVRGLKELSIEIGDALRDDNQLLDSMVCSSSHTQNQVFLIDWSDPGWRLQQYRFTDYASSWQGRRAC